MCTNPLFTMNCMWFSVLYLCYTYLVTIRGNEAASYRYNKDTYTQHLGSLARREENLESDLRREKDSPQKLESELKQLKAAGNAETEIHDGQRRSAELSDEMSNTVAEIVRNELKIDLEKITSVLETETQRNGQITEALEACKTGLTRFTSYMNGIQLTQFEFSGRLDDVEESMSELSHQMERVNEIPANSVEGQMNDERSHRIEGTTDVESTNPLSPMSGSDITVDRRHDRCPSFVKGNLTHRFEDGSRFGPEICHYDFYRVYLLKIKAMVEIPPSTGFMSTHTTLIAGFEIGGRIIHRFTWDVFVRLSLECKWPNMEKDKVYWVFSRKRTRRAVLDLEGAVVLDIAETGTESEAATRFNSTLYQLIDEDWSDLCRCKQFRTC